MNTKLLYDARAEALFVSDLQPSQPLTAHSVRAAIAHCIRAYGSRGCAARVAAEFGEHPETAVARMIWARMTVESFTVHPLATVA
jgi:hypothetical protein